MNRQKRILRVKYKPFHELLSPPLANNMSEDYTKKRRDARSDGEGRVMEWSGSLCLRRRLQFTFDIPMTWFEIHLKTH
jgi:hypothetical protein